VQFEQLASHDPVDGWPGEAADAPTRRSDWPVLVQLQAWGRRVALLAPIPPGAVRLSQGGSAGSNPVGTTEVVAGQGPDR